MAAVQKPGFLSFFLDLLMSQYLNQYSPNLGLYWFKMNTSPVRLHLISVVNILRMPSASSFCAAILLCSRIIASQSWLQTIRGHCRPHRCLVPLTSTTRNSASYIPHSHSNMHCTTLALHSHCALDSHLDSAQGGACIGTCDTAHGGV